MSTCCPNCGSAQSVGIEAASLCTECATATVAGASFNVPLLIVGAVVVAVTVFAVRMIRRRAIDVIQMKQPAVS